MADETVTTETVTTETAPEAPEAPEAETAAATAAATAEAAAQVATEAAQSAGQSAHESSSLLSAASATVDDLASLSSQNKLLRDNLDLIFRRLDQLSNVLQGVLAPFQASLEEMDTTADLMQQVIARQDEQQEQLAVALVALSRATTELTAVTAELTRPKRQQ